MCMMSVLTAYGQGRISDSTWNPETWKQFKQVAEQVQQLDADLGEPDCVDPEKEAWMQRIEARIQAIEAAQFRSQG